VVNDLGNSPLHICRSVFDIAKLPVLLSLFTPEELNIQNKEGNSALHYWVQNRSPFYPLQKPPENTLIDKVHKAGMKLDLVNHLGQGPLFVANTELYFIEPLLRLYPSKSINHQDKNGDTALHVHLKKLMSQYPEMTKLFLKYGANKDLRNKLKLAPYDLVRSSSKKNEFDFLK